jgi:Domain of unknown function (DUF5753)
VRIGRQSILSRRKPPVYVAAIGEFALRYAPCGAEVMAEQLHHLQEMMQRPNITIIVVPHRLGYYSPALFGPFVIVGTGDDKPLVQLESFGSSTTLTSVRAVGAYRAAADAIMNGSLDAERSAAFIEKRLKEMDRTT